MTERQITALTELQQKTLQQIQLDTAIVWAHRAWAAKQLDKTHDAVEYEHEALEHAALCGVDDAIGLVRQIIRGQ